MQVYTRTCCVYECVCEVYTVERKRWRDDPLSFVRTGARGNFDREGGPGSDGGGVGEVHGTSEAQEAPVLARRQALVRGTIRRFGYGVVPLSHGRGQTEVRARLRLVVEVGQSLAPALRRLKAFGPTWAPTRPAVLRPAADGPLRRRGRTQGCKGVTPPETVRDTPPSPHGTGRPADSLRSDPDPSRRGVGRRRVRPFPSSFPPTGAPELLVRD